RHRPDVGGSNAALGYQLPADCSEIIPPILAGAVLRPTGLRHDHAVGTAGLGDYSAALVDEGALARISADINAEIMAHPGSRDQRHANTGSLRPIRQVTHSRDCFLSQLTL